MVQSKLLEDVMGRAGQLRARLVSSAAHTLLKLAVVDSAKVPHGFGSRSRDGEVEFS